ncbi:MAG: FtsX-like permease family protein [Alphaproteobacteria bacterium]|jgi:putative ABC transport system permease protein|nr:FtsX-like permease family protein [Alphaproteobacteria bacterium]
MLGLAWRWSRRELRGGLRGFWVFLGCLALGVAAIAAVQSTATGIQTGLREDGRAILGGDLSIRVIFHQATAEQRAWLDSTADVSAAVEMRSMARARDGAATTLIELKAVDDAYPLYGSVALEGTGSLDDALSRRDGRWGAAVDRTVLDRLGLALGDRLAIGEAEFDIRAVIEREPDRASGANFAIGPRVMVARAAMDATGLLQPGSMIYTHYKLRLPEGVGTAAYRARLNERFPDAGWRVRDFTDAAPALQRMIERLTMFLTLVGLTALLVGGVGIGNAVKAFLDGKIATIATFKCLGAGGALVFTTYFLQVMALAGLGIAVGLAVGAAAPVLVAGLIADLLPIPLRIGVYPQALAAAAVFGLLTAVTFSLWPLARAREVPAASLFRDRVAPDHGWPRRGFVAATALSGLCLAGFAIATAADPRLAAGFVAAAIAALLLFRTAAWLIIAAARRAGRPRRADLRLALANLYRPGAPTVGVVLSLGLGLTVLVAIALIEGNMSRLVRDTMPRDAPAFFFVDIQPDQIEPFRALVDDTPGVGRVEAKPSLRGRIVAANGVPAEEALVNPEHGWLLQGDRGVSFAAEPRAADRVEAGEWWPADYRGPPLISIYKDIAAAFDIGVGDTLTVNILGREFQAEIANIRDIEWGSLNINFTMIFTPSTLQAAPHTYIATVHADEATEGRLVPAVAERFPNVTAVRVRDALSTVNRVFAEIGAAVRGIAGVTLLAGTLVLAGAIAAGHSRRVYEAVVLKVLGATRWDVARAFLLEYGLIGLLAGLIAAAIGTLAGWAVLTFVMQVEWTFLAGSVAVTTLLAAAITIGFGFVGTWWALGRKAAPLLRNE